MNRSPIRPFARFAAVLAIALGAGALASACSAIVQPDTNRLRPPGDTDGGGGTVDGGRVDGGSIDGGGGDGGALCPAGCDDTILCTTDACGGAGCTHTPDNSLCEDDERCSAVMGCVNLLCTRNEECDDGRPCTGVERCDPGSSPDPSGCVAGTAMVCSDGFACTNDLCVDATGGCVFAPRHAMCADAIDCTMDTCAPAAPGHDAAGCAHAGNDALCDDGFCFTGGRCNVTSGCVGSTPRVCDDGNACAVESCDAASSMCISAPRDADGDGHFVQRTTPFGAIDCPTGTDCDDTRIDVHPGAAEVCGNGRDDDCDGTIDDGCTTGTPGDVCASALPILLSGTPLAGTVSGSFATFADDYRLTCSQAGGRDAVYYFDLTSSADVVIDTIGSGSGQDTVLGVGFDCAAPALMCNDDQDVGPMTTSRVFLHRVGPTTAGGALRVYVYVDAYNSSTGGAFRVNVQIQRAHADNCTEPMDITGGGTVLGIGGFSAVPGPRGNCQTAAELGETEGVFRMRAPADGAHNQIDAFSTTFTPDIYMRTACATSSSEVACDLGASLGGGINGARINPGGLTAGAYQFLFVDGMTGTGPSGVPHGYQVDYDP